MKIFCYVLFMALILFYSCQNTTENNEKISTDIIQNPATANGEANTDKLPKIQFDNLEHDFGAIIEGEKVSYTFGFKNTGGADLVITSAKGSCGCTVPKFSREPIAPGKNGEIEIIFDSSGKSGIQHKTVTVLSNTQPNAVTLTITADVVTPKN